MRVSLLSLGIESAQLLLSFERARAPNAVIAARRFLRGQSHAIRRALRLGTSACTQLLQLELACAAAGLGYQTQGSLKSLGLTSGDSAAAGHRLLLTVELDLRVQRLLGADEGKPIVHILSPGKTAGAKSIDIDPAVQA